MTSSVDQQVEPKTSRTLRGQAYLFLQMLRGRPIDPLLRDLRKSESLSQEEFSRLQERCLADILRHAALHVPLYRTPPWRGADLAAGIGEWPVLEKRVVRERCEELLAEPRPRHIVIERTSGTTGDPIRIAMTPRESTLGWANRYRGMSWHGIPIGARALRMSHDARPLRDLVLGQTTVPSLGTPEDVDRAVQVLTAQRPMVVSGPPSTLFYLARLLRERSIETPRVPFARVGGEQLFTFQRREIESVLAGRAIDSYGANEMGALAGECPAGSLHVYADNLYVEIFHGDSPALPGELGDIVVTSLSNRTMPLVRYRVGDSARLSPAACSCGLPYPVLKDLQARSEDLFPAADGSLYHGSELAAHLAAFFAGDVAAPVRQLQFIQQSALAWAVSIEASPLLSTHRGDVLEPIERELATAVKRVFGGECTLTASLVDRIPRINGKLRYFRRASG